MDQTKNKNAKDLMLDIVSILARYSIYWLTVEALSWDLNVNEKAIEHELDDLVDLGLVERLELSIIWFKITPKGVKRLWEFKKQR